MASERVKRWTEMFPNAGPASEAEYNASADAVMARNRSGGGSGGGHNASADAIFKANQEKGRKRP